MKTQTTFKSVALWGGAAGVLLGHATAQETVKKSSPKETVPVVTSTPAKPAWLAELSLGVQEGYDSNVYRGGTDLPYSAPSAIPKNQIYTLKNVDSGVTTISPKIGINFIPLLGDQKLFQTLSVGYAGDYSIFTNASEETNEAHRFSTVIKGGEGCKMADVPVPVGA